MCLMVVWRNTYYRESCWRNTYYRGTYLWVFNTEEALYLLCALSLDPQAIALGPLLIQSGRIAQSEDYRFSARRVAVWLAGVRHVCST